MIDFDKIKQHEQVHYDLEKQLIVTAALADKYGLYDAATLIRDLALKKTKRGNKKND